MGDTNILAERSAMDFRAHSPISPKARDVEECPRCRRKGYYWNLSNSRRQCRSEQCLTMWKIGDAPVLIYKEETVSV